MNMKDIPTTNEWHFEGVVAECGDPLKNEKTGETLGVGVTLAQFGKSMTFYIPQSLHVPQVGERLLVSGVLVPKESGWAKTRVTAVGVADKGAA